MKDYKSCFGQYVKFVQSIEGVKQNHISIFTTKFRLSAFLKVVSATKKAAQTIANKTRMFIEVLSISNIKSIVLELEQRRR
jgi:hypothetical protein